MTSALDDEVVSGDGSRSSCRSPGRQTGLLPRMVRRASSPGRLLAGGYPYGGPHRVCKAIEASGPLPKCALGITLDRNLSVAKLTPPELGEALRKGLTNPE